MVLSQQKGLVRLFLNIRGVQKRILILLQHPPDLIWHPKRLGNAKEIPFNMPVTPATAKATYKNGVLCVTIKKEKREKKKTAISLE